MNSGTNIIEKNLFNKDDVNIFMDQIDHTDLSKSGEIIIVLYKSLVLDILRLVERGFTEDYKNINTKEWMIFLPKAIQKIDKLYNNYSGQEKLEILLLLCTFIIVKHLPIDAFTKELLIVTVKEFIPEIAEAIIKASKKMHGWWSRIKKKLKCC
jgi:hypothetical protein